MTTAQSDRPGFLARLYLAFVRLLILVTVLVALVAGGWFAYKEISRSFDNVTKRMDINTRRIEQADGDIAALLTRIDDQQQGITSLQSVIAAQDASIADLTEELATEQSHQDDLLAALDAQVAGSISNDITTLSGGMVALQNDITALSEGLVALQNDITNNGAQIDELGGTADNLQAGITNLNTQIEETQATLADFPAVEIVQMRQTLTLFRLWELMSRARLRLVEGNAGLAATDVELALAALGVIPDNVADEGLTSLVQSVEERLTLAFSNLPDDPITAARDLETAWETLDTALVSLLAGAE